MPSKAPISLTAGGQTPFQEKGVVVGQVHLIHRSLQPSRPASILETRIGKLGVPEVYISFPGEDKRLDTWVPLSQVGERQDLSPQHKGAIDPTIPLTQPSASIDRVRQLTPSSSVPQIALSEPSSPEREHEVVTRVRNFEDVRFGEYLIKTWYYSPYPDHIIDEKGEEKSGPAPTSTTSLVRSGSNKRRKINGDLPEGMAGPSKMITSMSNGHAGKTSASGMANGQQSKVKPMLESSGPIVKPKPTRGRIWVCDLCFKYMRNRASWDRHSSSCDMLLPPGRRVYQKGSYTLWEIDGAKNPLYCQNLSLFGKLFIDHKSVFFYVENFLFYVLCDAATSRRDQVMAFFSKEKISYDDYNLACIITFPPFQNRGFGKFLIEFSYYITQHPSTSSNGSPGTPERPLSDLGQKGYTAYWISVILRFCRKALSDAPPNLPPTQTETGSPSKRASARRSIVIIRRDVTTTEIMNGIEVTKIKTRTGQYSISLSLSDLAKACHLRIEDVSFTLHKLGFLQYRRQLPSKIDVDVDDDVEVVRQEEEEEGYEMPGKEKEIGEWTNTEIVITRESVDREWAKWRVRPEGVLDESCTLGKGVS